ncbi:MAG TPA: polyprenol phosphomannose-dependent alpha 1,6 mannosyltransferase MptB [Acidimicrobiales bacterium]|nr:polyprenol phosphomannose-dependent alpha 1,6 mannosyltransferase MptB [Acidimicrobiales bacterium]
MGSLCVLVGVTQSGSPFAVKSPGAWFFGIASGPSSTAGSPNARFLAILLVYLGVVVMLGSWFETVRTLRRQPNLPMKGLVAMLVAWAAPVVFMPPIFSRDVYSYAAQGEMVNRGINPYVHGPSSLGRGSFLALVDPLWRHAPAPYGPGWERLSGWIAGLARHDVLTTVLGLRMVALVGVVLIALGIPALAASVGRSGTVAFALAVLNPLVLLVLLGGAHNDALMLGLLVAGCALARRNHLLAGLVLCALAAEVKVPALIGAAFIGWWSRPEASWQERLPRVAAAVVFTVGVMTAVSAVSGLGWHWLTGLSNPGVVVSWIDPATAAGLLLGHGASLVGYGGHAVAFVQGSRAVGLGLAAVLSVGLVIRSKRFGEVEALGWSLLLFVLLGPVVWPWYETWGFVFLAVAAGRWTLRLVLFLSAAACFADVPSGQVLVGGNPVLVTLGWICLAAVIGAYTASRLLPSLSPLVARPSAARGRTA